MQEIYNITIQNMFSNSSYSHDYLFYACMVSQCTVVFDEKLDAPAGVSYSNCSYKLYINPLKFNEYSLLERLAILKHEMLHILNGHLLYRKDQMPNHKNANIAMDCAINQLIDSEHLPKNCITPEYIETIISKKVKKLEPSEYYYNLLQENKEKLEKIDEIDFDSHSSWDSSDSDESIETQKNITTEMIEESKEITLKTIGEYPNEYSKWLTLNANESKVNWKRLLKSYIKTNTKIKTIFKPNRMQPNRMDLKGSKKDKTVNILYIIDASQSVKNSEFKKLNSEIISLCSQFNLKINAIQVDSEASEPEVLSKNTQLIERKRNAGTFLSVGLDKAEEHALKYDTVIVSTDGYIGPDDLDNFKKINKNIIFLICSGGSDSIFKDAGNKIKSIKLD